MFVVFLFRDRPLRLPRTIRDVRLIRLRSIRLRFCLLRMLHVSSSPSSYCYPPTSLLRTGWDHLGLVQVGLIIEVLWRYTAPLEQQRGAVRHVGAAAAPVGAHRPGRPGCDGDLPAAARPWAADPLVQGDGAGGERRRPSAAGPDGTALCASRGAGAS